MQRTFHILAARLVLLFLSAAAVFHPVRADAYSVLSHEEIVDMAWKSNIVPMLRARFPGISDDDIRLAHAYAYGGSVIQDIGYYPFGSHYFSDLLHYVRPEDFVAALIHDSATPDEYAFALGALAHYCGDTIGHPAINLAVSDENPGLRRQYGKVVTYAEDPIAHVRTEFGFDVVEVAQGHYSQENYRDFIGFQVSKSLLDRAFQETYDIPVSDVMKHEDLAIGSYRRAVSALIPKMTKLAFVRYKDQIQQAAPGIEKKKFLYRLNQTEYQKDFGTNYQHVGVLGEIGAFFLRIVPKVGPFRALKVTLPDPRQQDIYVKSINQSVDKFRAYLVQIKAAPAPLPPPDPKDVESARQSAAKIAKEAEQVHKAAEKADDPGQKAALDEAAAHIDQVAAKASGAVDRVTARIDAGSDAMPTSGAGPVPVAAGTPIQPPFVPVLPHLDLDTGRDAGAGEYPLADETYARLLSDLARDAVKPRSKPIDPTVAADIKDFFATALKPTAPLTPKEKAAQASQAAHIQADLAVLARATPATP